MNQLLRSAFHLMADVFFFSLQFEIFIGNIQGRQDGHLQDIDCLCTFLYFRYLIIDVRNDSLNMFIPGVA